MKQKIYTAYIGTKKLFTFTLATAHFKDALKKAQKLNKGVTFVNGAPHAREAPLPKPKPK